MAEPWEGEGLRGPPICPRDRVQIIPGRVALPRQPTWMRAPYA